MDRPLSTPGSRIRLKREEHGFSVQDFAVALLSPVKVIHDLETDRFATLEVRHIETICRLLDTTIDDLLRKQARVDAATGLVHFDAFTE